MIVPTMSNSEVAKAVLADVDALQRKIPHIEREADRFVIKTKKFPFIKAYDYVTPKTKNTWIIILEKKSKNETLYSLINHHYSSKGFRAAMVTPEMEVVLLNGHLFKRFNTREDLNLPENPVIRVKDFFMKNPLFMIERIPTENEDVFQVICKVNTGLILGIQTSDVTICNTYLSNDLLRNDQKILAESLNKDMETFFEEWDDRKRPFRKSGS
jgi:hypothetical protein